MAAPAPPGLLSRHPLWIAALWFLAAAAAGHRVATVHAASATLLATLIAPHLVLPMLPFAAAGWLWSASFEAPREAFSGSRLVQDTAVVLSASRSFGEVQLTSVEASSGRIVLREPSSHPRRLPGEWLRVRGLLTVERSNRNPPNARPREPSLWAPEPSQVVALTGPRPGLPWLRHRLARFSADLGERASHRLPDLPARLTRALVLGQSEALPYEFRERLQRCGAYHFFAVSGLHIAVVGGAVLSALRALSVSRRTRVASALATVLVYCFVSGARPPVVRATLLFAGWCWQQQRRRHGSVTSFLGFALLAMCAARPSALSGPGLQLSFAAVVGISTASRYRRASSPKGTGRGLHLHRPLLRALWISLGATLATAPLAAFHFQRYSPWSPIATLLLTPLVLPLLLVSMAWIAVPDGLGLPRIVLAATATALSQALFWLVEKLDALPASPVWALEVRAIPVALLIGALLALHQRRAAVAASGALLAVLWSAWPQRSADPGLDILDVGHGICVLVRTPGRTDLIDAGTHGDAALPRRAFTHALRHLRIDRLDTFFISHLDADHLSLAVEVIETVPVDRVAFSSAHREAFLRTPAFSTVGRLRSRLRARDVEVLWLSAGDEIGPHRVLWPPAGRRFFSSNSGSLTLATQLGPSQLLLPGDLEGAPLQELTLRLGPLDLLLLPHHGNPDPTLGDLLDATRPRLTVASRGSPLATGVLALHRDRGIPVLSTARGGWLAIPGGDAGLLLDRIRRLE